MPKRKRLYGCALKKKKVTPIAKKGRKKKQQHLLKRSKKNAINEQHEYTFKTI